MSRNRRKWLCIPVLGVCGAFFYAGQVMATPQSGLMTKLLANQVHFGEIEINDHTIPADAWQARLKTQGESDGYVVDNVIQPGGTTGWHSHPGPSLIFVIAGEVTNYDSSAPNCAGQTYGVGSGFVDHGGGDVHMLKNNGDVAAETIAVQILPKDAPRRIDAPSPDGCPP